ncbi:probable RNA-binding protein 18 isoform X2 [Myotis lucifugus]|uniref:probable RNA-binding protein 18 isoform X2 n=1 Tax=Myotis lucifugus TaxID=59463 RepID=UPI000CCBE83B|nr:probable RNA-binding protein 18 isoform X2 [Myotis lucifugus]
MEAETKTLPLENASILSEGSLQEGHRLWIGNLDPKITEYHLLKLLQKFGTVKQFDFLFHKSGALEGQPRGYCFVNFETKQEAEQAIQCLNGKLALSKKLVVRWAHAQVKVVSHRVFSASRAHYLENRNEENYQRLFYSKENPDSFARLAVIFSFCISLKRDMIITRMIRSFQSALSHPLALSPRNLT